MAAKNEVNQFNPLVGTPQPMVRAKPDAVTQAQYAQERFFSLSEGRSNPAFRLTSDFNRLAETNGAIMRGYIRRSDIDPADPTSQYRLYFMYNPETIQRSYIAYLDQQALDPGNSLFGSNNMTAPPGILDFNFELLFDRHIEVSSDPGHPGTKVDYDFFDLVVRGVVPDSGDTGNAIPDNGIMMVNPNNIAVVFGQDLAVQGKAYNASVRFEKFNNRMVPTRLRIGLALKAFYIGPVQTIPNYSMNTNQGAVAATVPYENNIKYKIAGADKNDTIILAAARTIRPVPNSVFPSPFTGPGVTVNATHPSQIPFAQAFLTSLGAPQSADNMNFMIAWQRAESGNFNEYNNPLNTTLKKPGSWGVNDNNGFPVQGYPSFELGVEASVDTILEPRYATVVDDLVNSRPAETTGADLIASGWGTGQLLLDILRYN